jgi:MFS family permease
MNLGLLRRTPNYLGSTLSQALAGMAEMGLGLLFPLLLILNLGMNPALAGLALIPTALPMVLLSRVAGSWYDRAGGRAPLATGFGILAAAGLALWVGVAQRIGPRVRRGLRRRRDHCAGGDGGDRQAGQAAGQQ